MAVPSPIRTSGALMALGAALLVSVPAKAATSPSPPPRAFAAMAGDPASGTAVLFGGSSCCSIVDRSDTWTWDGVAWTAAEGPGPPAAFGPSMAYDELNKRVLLVNNRNGSLTQPMETWRWNGAARTWTQEILSVTSPPGRREAAMAYDAGSRSIVLFGGLAGGVTALDDTWTWDGANRIWTKQTPPVSPSPRYRAVMAYDKVRGKVLLFGGAAPGLDDTWSWDGVAKTWTKESPALSPPPTDGAAMAYHPGSRKIVMFGGSQGNLEATNDTWMWDGATANWTKATPLLRPPARRSASMASHAGTGTAVLFGGTATQSSSFGDTWAWDGRNWRPDNQVVTGPVVAVGDATVAEGDAGTRNAVFTVSLSEPSPSTVTVDYATADRSAVSAPQPGPAGDDYGASSGTLSFSPGTTALTVKVPVVGDSEVAGSVEAAGRETFLFRLSGAIGATIGDDSGLGTILEDDPDPGLRLAVGDVAAYEGNAGSRAAVFNVSLSSPSPSTVTVAYATANGTALKSSDYTKVGGTLSFGPGMTSQAIKVPISPDVALEPDETFAVKLSAPNGAVVSRATGTGTVPGDD